MQRGSVLPLLLIIGVIISIGVGFFYYRYYSPVDLKHPPELTNEYDLGQVASPMPSETTQIQVVDDLLGLHIILPKGYLLKKETEEEYFKRANGQIRKNFASYIQYSPAEFVKSFYILAEPETNPDKAVVSLWAFKNPDNLSPEDFYKEYWYYPFVWGDFTAAKNKIAPQFIESVGGKEGKFGVVDYRPGKPKFIYLPLENKNLMLQIQLPTEATDSSQEILNSFKFE